MKSRCLRLLALLSLSLGALAACSDAIYSTVEIEKKTATNTLSQTLSVFGIAVSPASTYYIAAGAIFRGVLSGSTVSWTPNASDNSRPWNPSGLLCNAMVLFGSNLFGGFIAQDGTPSLYRSSVSPYSFATGASVATASAGEQVTMLGATAANLFVGGATLSGNNYVYQLDYSSNPGTVAWNTALSGLTYPLVGVASIGATHWTASGSTLYTSTALPTFSQVTAQSWGTINGVFADAANNRVFVVTKSNGIYYSADGGLTWPFHIGADVVGTATVSYLTVGGPADTGNDKYLVGSDGYGYYTLSISAGTMSRFSDSTIALYSASVSRITLDGFNVLMGTNAKGLWRGVFDSTGALASGQSWINE